MQNTTTTHPRSWALTALASMAAICIRAFALVPNMSPVGALSLYSGGRLRWWLAWIPPIAVMAISDVILAYLFAYSPFNAWVYAGFVVYVVIGRWLAQTNAPARIATASALGSLQFFLITNFGTWYGSHGLAHALYPSTFAGLLDCYIAGLPFLGYTLLGDLVFSTILFGTDAMLVQSARKPAPQPEEIRA